MIKKWIADFLDSICAKTYEPKDFYVQVVNGLPYITPIRKE